MEKQIKPVKIGNKLVGPNQPCFIIAEAGVNHNGDLKKAKKLIDVAVTAGADVVKFQTFVTENIVTRSAERAKYQKLNMPSVDESQWQMLKKLELNKTAFSILKTYASKKGIMFFSTPYDIPSIDMLDDLGVSAFKVSSAWITNLPFLKHMASKGKPIIFSRGMSYEDEISEAIQTMKAAGAKYLVLMHCHFNYPTDIADVNLRVLGTLRDKFGLPTGFSDHSQGISASLAAVALGAVAIEKHFTLDKNLPGPDHKASLEPDELKSLIKGIREIEKALGSPKIQVSKNEAPMRLVSRTSVVSKVTIPKDTIITRAMIAIKRPGTGILPKDINKVIGKKAKLNIKSDSIITWREIQ